MKTKLKQAKSEANTVTQLIDEMFTRNGWKLTKDNSKTGFFVISSSKPNQEQKKK